MTHTFDSEVSLHSWLLWPRVRHASFPPRRSVKLSSYLLLKFSRVPFTIVLIPLVSTMANDTLLNFGKRYEDDLRVIFDQWPKLLLDLDVLSNQKILNGVF